MGGNDSFLLDAYSQTVSGVVERIAPTVAAVRVLDTSARHASGGGSGFLFTPDGYLLTNSHVARAGQPPTARRPQLNYRIALGDTREFDAEWVGDDPDSDLALLRIDSRSRGSLSHAVLGRSADVRRGDRCEHRNHPGRAVDQLRRSHRHCRMGHSAIAATRPGAARLHRCGGRDGRTPSARGAVSPSPTKNPCSRANGRR